MTTTEKLEKILNIKSDLILDNSEINSLFEKINESEFEKSKLYTLVKNKLELLISNTPSGDLRKELSEINILLTFLS